MSSATRYPLSWPVGWKRTPTGQRQRARFSYVPSSSDGLYRGRQSLSVYRAVARLDLELTRLGATGEILSTNIRVRLDGVPRSDAREPDDPGVAVYFELKRKPRTLACDRWKTVADNIAAIAAHVSAIRAVERYGVGTLEQAFAGYAQLRSSPEDWWIVLGIPPTAGLDQVEEAYAAAARRHHPDLGGDPNEMVRVNLAREAARIALEVKGDRP